MDHVTILSGAEDMFSASCKLYSKRLRTTERPLVDYLQPTENPNKTSWREISCYVFLRDCQSTVLVPCPLDVTVLVLCQPSPELQQEPYTVVNLQEQIVMQLSPHRDFQDMKEPLVSQDSRDAMGQR